jgi:cold shock protein
MLLLSTRCRMVIDPRLHSACVPWLPMREHINYGSPGDDRLFVHRGAVRSALHHRWQEDRPTFLAAKPGAGPSARGTLRFMCPNGTQPYYASDFEDEKTKWWCVLDVAPVVREGRRRNNVAGPGGRMTGTIRTLRTDKGFGFIKDAGGKDYFFHQSAVQGEGINDLREGDSVEFEVGDGPKGPRAEKVRRTST